MSDNALIKVRNVSFSYQSKQIYKNLTLDIPKGKITAILGPSGTGKTTILRLIGAQLTPNEGTIEFDGTNIHSLNRTDLYKLRQRMSMLFQSGALFSDMNVFENVAFLTLISALSLMFNSTKEVYMRIFYQTIRQT